MLYLINDVFFLGKIEKTRRRRRRMTTTATRTRTRTTRAWTTRTRTFKEYKDYKDTTGLKLHQQKKKVLEDPKAVLIPP